MKRVTVKDIARKSGYSVATVSKTLNGTDRVGAETMEKIRKIAAEMGYRSSFSAQSLARKARKVAIVLFRNPFEVRNLFETGFRQAFDLYGEFGIEPEYHLFENIAEVDWATIGSESDAVILTPSNGIERQREDLEALGGRIPLVILQTRSPVKIASQLSEITVNARVAGAMAAQFLGICEPDIQTAIVTGYAHGWIHSENICGFLETAHRRGVENLAVEECFDDMDRAYASTRSLLNRHEDLRGIFVTSYVSPAVCRCVKDMGRDVHVIGVDLFGDSTACLQEGSLDAAIFQNQQWQAQLALEAVVNSFRGISVEPSVLVKPELVLNANLSCYGWV